MADDMVFAETIVYLRLEDLNTLSGDLCAAKPAYEFLAFAAEHAAANHFDPPQIHALMLQLFAHDLKGRQLYL
jgi:hypothetical protein